MLSKTPYRVAVVEMNTYHTEVVYPQLLFLKEANVEVTLVIDEHMDGVYSEWYALVDHVVKYDMKKIWSIIKVRGELYSGRYDVVVFNTLAGNKVMKFCLMPPPVSSLWKKKPLFAGVVHDMHKVAHSLSQKIICHRVKNVFVLADYIDTRVFDRKEYKVGVLTSCFYPHDELAVSVEVNKPDGELWVCVPGNVEFKRRDYEQLVTMAGDGRLSSRVKFVILGNSTKKDGPKLVDMIRDRGLDDRFILFAGWIDNATYDAYIHKSDILLPLISEETETKMRYRTDRLSGTFNIALGYGKTMLIDRMFENIDKFDYPSCFYSTTAEAVEGLNAFDARKYECVKADFEKSCNEYLSFLGIRDD